MLKIKGQPCRKCHIRKIRYREGTCQPCHFLLLEEGTHEKYGIEPKTRAQLLWEATVAEYNKLARTGLSQPQIAAAMGVELTVLRSRLGRAKSQGGLAVVNLLAIVNGVIPEPTKIVNAKMNSHGGGRWGVKGCHCHPCVAVRSESRKRISEARKA